MILTKYFWQSKPIFNFKNFNQKQLDLRVNIEIIKFSNDGRFLAMTYEKGKTEIINTITMKIVKEITTLIFNQKEDILFFTPDSIFFVLQYSQQQILVMNMYQFGQKSDFSVIELEYPSSIIYLDDSQRLFVKSEYTIEIYTLAFCQQQRVILLEDISNRVFSVLDRIFFTNNEELVMIKRSGKSQKTQLFWPLTSCEQTKFYQLNQFVLNTTTLTYQINLWHWGLQKKIRSLKLDKLHCIQGIFLDKDFTIICSYDYLGEIKLRQINALQYQEVNYFFVDVKNQSDIICCPKAVLLKYGRKAKVYCFQ